MQAGQLKMPPGYHPLDVEKEWGKLHVAILEREKQLRSEFERWAALGLGGCGWAGRGPVVAGKPPEGESLPGEEIPPASWETHTWASGTVSCRLVGRPGAAGDCSVAVLGAWRAIPSL